MITGGGHLTKRPCCFSADGGLLLVPSGNAVRLYDCESGDLVGRLQGHDAEVTAVAAPRHAVGKVRAGSTAWRYCRPDG